MAWMLVHPQIHNIFASLGVQHGSAFRVSDDCLAILGEIFSKLSIEDRTLRTFRRAIGFGQHIRKDLLPLLIHVKDDNKTTDATKIIDATIKILVNLTIPVECLLSMEALSKTHVGRHTIFEINKLLYSSKEAFVDSRSIKAVTDHMKFVIERGAKLELEQCDSINNCLLLLRNILHIPEHRVQISNCPLAHNSMQNKILWNLFTQSIDKLLLHLMTFPQKIYWVVTMVQLIALMYKDQYVGTLQKLLSMWFETSLSDSSEDNESNTSPPPPNQTSGDSSPMLTSDPTTSDSSDNAATGAMPSVKQHIVRSQQNRNKVLLTSQKQRSTDDSSSTSSRAIETKSAASKSSTNHSEGKDTKNHSELSDYGYGTQVENQESISTSSNDDETPQQKPVHQKPHMVQKPRNKTRTTSPQEKKEMRRKKLIKRSKINIINVKGLLHYSPTDDDISNILKEFTVDFLLKGYGSLVHELYVQVLSTEHLHIDTSHIFWLITYFLKFATQLELDFEHIEPVLSFNIIAYLTYEGVNLCEQLELSNAGVDLKPNLRRIHLVVTAIKEFLQAIEVYKRVTHLTKENHESLTKLQIQIARIDNLKSLMLLLIRHYNPNIQSRLYLQDLITTNHTLLLFLDNAAKLTNNNNNIVQHLKHFANVEVMHQYGLLLEDFENNGRFINDCIFTMMHHIGGDIDNVSTLFQPNILKTFSRIWESEYEICDDWSDLIEYVIHKFINVPRQPAQLSTSLEPKNVCNFQMQVTPRTENDEKWTEEDNDALYWYYIKSRECENVIENIQKLYREDGLTNKTPESILQNLLKQNMITQDYYDEYMKKTDADTKNKKEDQEYRDLKKIKEKLVHENHGDSVLWLQEILLETCYCKIIINNKDLFKENMYEPIPYCYAKLHHSIPIIPWNEEQTNIIKNETFILLLNKLGFHLPSDSRKLFIRIPHFWSANHLYNIAQKLGPVDSASLKFDINLLKNDENLDPTKTTDTLDVRLLNKKQFSPTQNIFEVTTLSPASFPLLPNISSNWFQTVLQSKLNQNLNIIPDEQSLNIPIPNETSSSISAVEKPSKVLENVTPLKPEQKSRTHEEFEHNSACDTISVASDLTRMYVSDEEDKH